MTTKTRAETARQGQGADAGIIGALVIGAVLFIAARSRGGADGGNGGTGNGATGDRPPAAELVRPAGALLSVRLAQQQIILRSPGVLVSPSVTWVASTVNSDGRPIPWDYRLMVEMGHNTFFGWRRPEQLGFDESGRQIVIIRGSTPGEHIARASTSGSPAFSTAGILRGFVVPDDRGVTYDIRVELSAARSDDFGRPIGDQWERVAKGEAVGAMRVKSSELSTIGGAIGAVTLAQRPVRRGRDTQRARPRLGHLSR